MPKYVFLLTLYNKTDSRVCFHNGNSLPESMIFYHAVTSTLFFHPKTNKEDFYSEKPHSYS
jgi:hypothetical protein